MHGLVKWLLIGLALALLLALLLLAAFVALGLYVNWSAEKHARSFCDETPIGSEISAATARADHKKFAWSAGDGRWVSADQYVFIFPGFVMDKAGCRILVDRDGKVRSKTFRKAAD